MQQFLLSLTANSESNSISKSASAAALTSGSWTVLSENVSQLTDWKYKVAVELLDSLNLNRLARVICSQVTMILFKPS